MKIHLGENDFGYVFPQGDVSSLDKVETILKEAGGKPKECNLEDYSTISKGKAKPEYIITFNDDSNILIVVECKKQIKQHETKDKNKPNSYAVDGVLYYAKYLKKEYNIIAIAISGTKKKRYKSIYFLLG